MSGLRWVKGALTPHLSGLQVSLPRAAALNGVAGPRVPARGCAAPRTYLRNSGTGANPQPLEVSRKNLSRFVRTLPAEPEAARRYWENQSFPNREPRWVPSTLSGVVSRRGLPGCVFLTGATMWAHGKC